MRTRLSENMILDGYRLVRRIGAGGFGEVWLCRSGAMGGWHALKFIHETTGIALDREFQALALYRSEAARLRSPHLVAIEHINRLPDSGLFYVMPLADGEGAISPENPAWRPVTLGSLLEQRASAPMWFSSAEIIALMKPVLGGLQLLADRGLVHRDVKPDNILFFGNIPCLGDVGLLARDDLRSTALGTPGFACPSWYRGGHPDMFAAGVTLFTLLTGNPPDRMGRASFKWPPKGEPSLSRPERKEWIRLHAVIRRATEEKVSERFVDFGAMAKALEPGRPTGLRGSGAGSLRALMRIGLVATLATVAVALVQRRYEESPEPLITAPPDAEMMVTSEPANQLAIILGGILGKSPEMVDMGQISMEQSNLCQQTLSQTNNHLVGGPDSDIPAAHRAFENVLRAVPELAREPDSRLALMALRKHSGLPPEQTGEAIDPGLLEFDDGITKGGIKSRSGLFRLLGQTAAAEEFLSACASRSSMAAATRSSAFFERAKLRASNGRFAEASEDLRRSLELVKDNPSLEAALRNEMDGLTDQYPRVESPEAPE